MRPGSVIRTLLVWATATEAFHLLGCDVPRAIVQQTCQSKCGPGLEPRDHDDCIKRCQGPKK